MSSLRGAFAGGEVSSEPVPPEGRFPTLAAESGPCDFFWLEDAGDDFLFLDGVEGPVEEPSFCFLPKKFEKRSSASPSSSSSEEATSSSSLPSSSSVASSSASFFLGTPSASFPSAFEGFPPPATLG